MATKDTKNRIMDTAERLFANNGYKDTSIRAITSEAGVNLAAVNFHFGSKFDLLVAILKQRLGPINRKQLQELHRLEEEFGDGLVDLEAVLRAFIRPILNIREELGEAGDRFLALASQTLRATDHRILAAFHSLVNEVIGAYLPLIKRALPSTEAWDLNLKLHLVLGLIADTVEWCLDGSGIARSDPSEKQYKTLESLLLRFACAGMRA